MTLRVRWKKPVKLAITLDPVDVEGAQEIGGNTSDNYTRAEMPFNSQMIEFFKGSDINDLTQRMFAYIKIQVENRSLVIVALVRDLGSETKGTRFKSGCQLCAEVSSLQQSPG